MMITHLKKTQIMGILNVTPDSFSDGGKFFQIEDAIKQLEKLIKGGADIIDIGGESTRPNAKPISEEEELRRVIPVVKWCRDVVNHVSTLISIDTYKSKVAEAALNVGAEMINDVSGLTMDPGMVKVIAKFSCKVVIMHNCGIPATKPELANWRTGEPEIRRSGEEEIGKEVYNWLEKQTGFALANGVKRENIIIDPGIGFGKTAEEDFEIINNLKKFKSLDFPIMVGISRKSFMKKLFGEDRTKEMIDLIVKNGADIVRVHELVTTQP